jgi:phospholipid transport system substrate-binding protein
MLTRRALTGSVAAALTLISTGAARALSTGEAESFVKSVISDVESIVKAASPGDKRTDQFLSLFRRVAALPEIGRFTMGANWRVMNDAQKAAFQQAFETYAARAYANRVGDYKGQTIEVTGSQDLGKRGIVVHSVLKTPGAEDIAIDWLVSDRSGKVQLADIIGEGVSLSINQREQFAAMVEARNGDIDRFIADLGDLNI